MANVLCQKETFIANGNGAPFAFANAFVTVTGKVTAAGAVGATIKLQGSNVPGDANSWIDVCEMTLAGTNLALDYVEIGVAFTHGRLVVSGLTGSLVATVSAGDAGAADTVAYRTVTIVNGQSLSPAIDLGTRRLARIGLPAAFEGPRLSFQVSIDGTTWRDLYDAAGEYNILAGPNRSVVPDLSMFAGARFLKIRSGLSAAVSNVAANRTLELTLLA